MDFIVKPSRYWVEGGLKQKHLVQSLMFMDAIEYSKESGFGTANFSLPFKLLQETSGSNSNLVEAAGIKFKRNLLILLRLSYKYGFIVTSN